MMYRSDSPEEVVDPNQHLDNAQKSKQDAEYNTSTAVPFVHCLRPVDKAREELADHLQEEFPSFPKTIYRTLHGVLVEVVTTLGVGTVNREEAEQPKQHIDELEEELEQEHQKDNAPLKELGCCCLDLLLLVEGIDRFVEDISSSLTDTVDDAQRG